jgi:hypothetical protein
LESSLEATDGRVPPRSIRTTGRMTTIAAPACTGGGFWCGARRGSGNTTTVPMSSPGRQRIEGTPTLSMSEAIPPHDLRPSWLMARYQTRTVAICSRAAPGRDDNGAARILERGCAGEGWKRRSGVPHGGLSVRVRACRPGAANNATQPKTGLDGFASPIGRRHAAIPLGPPRGSPVRFARFMVNRALKNCRRENLETEKELAAFVGASVGRECTTLRPCEPTRVARRCRPSPRNPGLTAVSIIRSGHRENERSRGAGIGVGKSARLVRKTIAPPVPRPLVPKQYCRIENQLPFIYDESESNFPLRHNRATIFFIGQHGRVS